jgi:predicted O-methyltransferase YrrM
MSAIVIAERHQCRFSQDFFSHDIPHWEKLLARFSGKPDLKFLEVGVFEGRSSYWLLTKILTHPTSRLFCVDTFEGSMEHQPGMQYAADQLESLYDTFIYNVSPFSDRVYVRVGPSQEVLRDHELYSYDFIYIDGSHKSSDVLEDGILCFRLLKAGGIMIFDDYEWQAYVGTLDNPRRAIDTFLEIYVGKYTLLMKNYQVAIQKL